jgi:(heptosyl)LPS beta-1,4-glucosyltransferase
MDGKEGLFLAILYSYYTFLKYLYLFYNVYNEGP